MRTNERLTRESIALLVSLGVLLALVAGLASCGDEDIFFPGELLPSATAEATNTSTPDEDDDDF